MKAVSRPCEKPHLERARLAKLWSCTSERRWRAAPPHAAARPTGNANRTGLPGRSTQL